MEYTLLHVEDDPALAKLVEITFIADTADLPDLKQRAIDLGRMAFKN
jgi:hypothetical protein